MTPEPGPQRGLISLDLDLDLEVAGAWFSTVDEEGYTLVKIPAERLGELHDSLGPIIRRCYIADGRLENRARDVDRPQRELLEALLPDRPPIMAGDFGEILAAVFEVTRHLPVVPLMPKKWRLKEDKNQPAPHSDVIHFVLPSWPTATEQDLLVCSEVKTKSTSGSSRPISAAVEGARKDQTSRLVRTLVWLRERALLADLGEVRLEHLDRFIHSEEHSAYIKRFQAVVCVCSSLVTEVLQEIPLDEDLQCQLILIEIPSLQDTYVTAFDAALASLNHPHRSRASEN